MKRVLVCICISLLLKMSAVRAATEVLAWVQNGYGAACYSNLQQSYGGVSPKDVLTAVAVQFWLLSSNGTLQAASDPTNLRSIVSWAHNNSIKVLLTVYNANGNGDSGWDWDGGVKAAISNPNNFVSALMSEVSTYNLDGIDLDLEGYNVAQGDLRSPFSSFISSLSSQLKASSKILTVCTTGDVPDSPDNVPNSDWWKDWVGKVDFVHTMLYAEGGGANLEGTDPNVAGDDQYYYSTQQQIGVSDGYPASAISMGLPSFDSDGSSSDAASWNQGWSTHFDQCLAINASVCFWDMELLDANWKSGALWTKLKQFKSNSSNYSLAITTVGSGTVTKNPNSSTYAPGTSVQLTATPSSGFTFTGWSGAVTGTQNPAAVTMNANKAVTATFTSNNPGSAFDMLANGSWVANKDDFGSTIIMTKTAASAAANWSLVKNPLNDYSWVNLEAAASSGSYAGLSSIVITYSTSANKPILISLVDPMLDSTGDDFQDSLPATTTASTLTLTTSNFAQQPDPTTKGTLRLGSITSIAFSPDVDPSASAMTGTFTITQFKVNGTTLSGTKAKVSHSPILQRSKTPIVRSVAGGLEIENLQNTKLMTVYNAVGQALASLTPSSAKAATMHVALGKNSGIVFVRSQGTDGSSSVQRIIR
jgi:uncharacterized repeat protein (TIGR02543 family)